VITGTGLSESLTHLFATVTSRCTLVVLVGAYSAGLECSFPGRKQVGRGSVLGHGSCNRQSRAPLDWVIHIYNASEALPNLVNLFWMLRLLGILKPRARDLAGYGMLQLVVQVPIVFLLCWLFSLSIPFVPPIK